MVAGRSDECQLCGRMVLTLLHEPMIRACCLVCKDEHHVCEQCSVGRAIWIPNPCFRVLKALNAVARWIHPEVRRFQVCIETEKTFLEIERG